MKKIIVIYGASRTGKTTVINDIYNDFLSNGATVLSTKKQIGGDPKDFTAELKYKGKSIAFLSMGDYLGIVNDHVDKYKNDIIFITALNTRFSTIGSIWLKNSDIICKIDKTKADNMDNSKVKQNVVAMV